jgi:eukaryotic-like serine/threonine-protein kinase
MNSPTLTAAHGTQLGVILGTAAYMAPEQARGAAVDQRADVWAFGVVLYEMLAGKSLFAAATVTDTLAGVLMREIDLGLLPAGPAALRRLLRRCLERNPRNRYHAIADARLELQEMSVPDPGPPVAGGRWAGRWQPWMVAAFAAALAAWALLARPGAGPEPPQGHLTIALPDAAPIVTLEIPGSSDAPLALSPDGRQVVYTAPSGTGTRLFARAMDDPTPRALPGTEGAQFPFFSPDGQWVGFFAGGRLMRASLAGGTPATLADAPDGRGASWGDGGEIVFAPGEITSLGALPDARGTRRAVTTFDFAAGDDSHRWPQILPGHRVVLFTVMSWSRETSDLVLVDLDSGDRRIVQRGAGYGRYAPAVPGASTGYLFFVRGGVLMAAPLDPSSDSPAGAPVPVVEGVREGQFDVSASGVLAYVPGNSAAPVYSLVWVDRSGAVSPINDVIRGYEDLHLSPDGRRVALTVEEDGPSSPAHVWLADTARGTLDRFTFDGLSRDPIWAPDGASVVFGSKRGDSEFGLYRQRLDGLQPAELLWASPAALWPDPQSWTPDGRVIIFNTKGNDSNDDLWTLALDGSHAARPWLATPAAEWAGRLSPDGRFLAYNSDESGRVEVYVQPFPGPGAKRLVSQGGGFNAIWSRDGRELFYRRGDQILEVDVETDGGFVAGRPTVLFSGRYRATGRDFDASPDGRRFVMMRNDEPRTSTTVNVLLDWRRALASRSRGGSS